MALILVIDDELAARQLLRRTLEEDGHDVIEAEDGVVGCRLADEHLPDLCVTDVLMPDKEGIETIHDLRKSIEGIKIVAISGGGRVRNMSFLEIAKSVGADAVLTKPFRPGELLALVDRLLGSVGDAAVRHDPAAEL